MNGDGNLKELAIRVPGHKHDVKALAQKKIAPLSVRYKLVSLISGTRDLRAGHFNAALGDVTEAWGPNLRRLFSPMGLRPKTELKTS